VVFLRVVDTVPRLLELPDRLRVTSPELEERLVDVYVLVPLPEFDTVPLLPDELVVRVLFILLVLLVELLLDRTLWAEGDVFFDGLSDIYLLFPSREYLRA